MKQTSDLSKKTKTQLTALARRKKIPVTSGMLKDDLVKTIKKGLKKIEGQKKSKTAGTKTRKKATASKTAKKVSKKKSTKKPRVKTARKPKSTPRKIAAAKRKAAPAGKKKMARKKSSVKAKVKKTPAKKTAARQPKKTATRTTVQSQRTQIPSETPSELPERYGDHRLVALVRDPNWVYIYWDLSAARVRDLLDRTGQSDAGARWVLRVYSSALQPVEERGHYFDVDIDVKTGSYYLDLSRPGARVTMEIGVIDASGQFRATAQSNPVTLPLDHPSETTAVEGTSPSQAPGFPFGGSSPADASSPGREPEDLTSGSGFSKPPSSGSQ